MACFGWANTLDFQDVFDSTIVRATCTANQTWQLDTNTTHFCKDESTACTYPIIPNCEDRSIRCLDAIPKSPPGFKEPEYYSNPHLVGLENKARYRYNCSEPGKIFM